jgi:hypothetical protein
VLEVVEANIGHAVAVAANMRPADIQEVEAFGSAPLGALVQGITNSCRCHTMLVDGEPAMIWGVTQLMDDMWSPWALGTNGIKKIRKTFLAFCRKDIQDVIAKYPLLYNRVDARNQEAIDWIKWMGFEVLPAEPAGINGELFHPFVMRAA